MRKSKKIEGTKIICEYDSSNIKQGIFDTETNKLDITFNSKQTYRYSEVTHELFTEFDMAKSQGKLFNQKMRKLKFEKLTPTKPKE